MILLNEFHLKKILPHTHSSKHFTAPYFRGFVPDVFTASYPSDFLSFISTASLFIHTSVTTMKPQPLLTCASCEWMDQKHTVPPSSHDTNSSSFADALWTPTTCRQYTVKIHSKRYINTYIHCYNSLTSM